VNARNLSLRSRKRRIESTDSRFEISDVSLFLIFEGDERGDDDLGFAIFLNRRRIRHYLIGNKSRKYINDNQTTSPFFSIRFSLNHIFI
jgi:hypothetical protein